MVLGGGQRGGEGCVGWVGWVGWGWVGGARGVSALEWWGGWVGGEGRGGVGVGAGHLAATNKARASSPCLSSDASGRQEVVTPLCGGGGVGMQGEGARCVQEGMNTCSCRALISNTHTRTTNTVHGLRCV